MKNYLKTLILLLLLTNLLVSYIIQFPNLDVNELKFKPLKSYSIQDFKISRKIKYFEIISFNTKEYIGNKFELEEPFKYEKLFVYGTISNTDLVEKSREILANIIIKQNYFWRWQEYPTLKYRYNLLNFFEKRDKRMKAIENKKEILKILKKINTEAELLLWIKVIERADAKPYSYKYIDGEYRVRFFEVSPDGCHIKEYLEYIDKKGKVSKRELLRDENIEGCETQSSNL